MLNTTTQTYAFASANAPKQTFANNLTPQQKQQLVAAMVAQANAWLAQPALTIVQVASICFARHNVTSTRCKNAGATTLSAALSAVQHPQKTVQITPAAVANFTPAQKAALLAALQQ